MDSLRGHDTCDGFYGGGKLVGWFLRRQDTRDGFIEGVN